MKNKELLNQKQILNLNGYTVMWEPCTKEGDTRWGKTYVGFYHDATFLGGTVYTMDEIKSVEPATSEEVAKFKSSSKLHAEGMNEYYAKNSYTGD